MEIDESSLLDHNLLLKQLENARISSEERVQIHEQYLEKTNIKLFDECVKLLLQESVLPQNPYLVLSRILDLWQHKNRLWNDSSDAEIEEKQANKIVNIGIEGIYKLSGAADENSPFGCQTILKFCDYEYLSLIWKVILEGPSTLSKALDGSQLGLDKTVEVKVLTSLIGDSVLCGKVKNQLNEIEINQDYIMKDKNFEKVVTMFSNHILILMKNIQSSGEGLVEGVYLATAARNLGEEGDPQVWLLKNLLSKTEANKFTNAVKATCIGKRRIWINVLYRVEWEGVVKYIKIIRYFTLHHDDDNGLVRNFAFYPYNSVVRGLFWSKEDVLAYRNIYRNPKEEQVKSFNANFNIQSIKSIKDTYEKGDELDAYYLLMSIIALENKSEVIPDFKRIASFTGAKFRTFRKDLDILIYVIEFYMDLKNVSSSTSPLSRKNISKENKLKKKKTGLFNVATGFTEEVLDEDIIELFETLKVKIMTFLFSGQMGGVNNFIFIFQKMFEEIIGEDNKILQYSSSLSFYHLSKLKKISNYLLVLEIQSIYEVELLMDYLGRSIVRSFLMSIIENNQAPPEKQAVEKQLDISFAKTKAWVHKFYPEDGMVLDIEKEVKRAIEGNKYPLPLAHELTILQYVVDTRLDVCMQEIHFSLMTGTLTPRPFKVCVDKVKKFCQLFLMFEYTDSFIYDKNFKVKFSLSSLNPAIQCLTIPSRKDKVLYGTFSSLYITRGENVVDTHMRYSDILKNNTVLPMPTSIVEKISLIYTQDTLFSTKIEVNSSSNSGPSYIKVCEVYTFEGSDLKKALTIYAKHVIKYLQTFQQSLNIIFRLRILDSSPSQSNTATPSRFVDGWLESVEGFTGTAINNDANKIEGEIVRGTLSKQPVSLYGVIINDDKTKFILVKKDFVFVFIEKPSLTVTSFIPPNDYSIYQGVFMSGEEMLEYMKGYFETKEVYRDPHEFKEYSSYLNDRKKHIQHYVNTGDLLSAYRELLLLSAIRKDETYIHEICRVMGSCVYRLKFLNISYLKTIIVYLQESVRSSEVVISKAIVLEHLSAFEVELMALVKTKELLSFQGIWSKVQLIIKDCKDGCKSEAVNEVELLRKSRVMHDLISTVYQCDAFSCHANCTQVDSYFKMILAEQL